MGFKAENPVTDLPVEASLPVQEPPRDGELMAGIPALLSQSDKDLRIMYQGLYQAVLQSAPVFSAGVINNLDHWHRIVDTEVEYFLRRVLEKSRT